MERRFGVHAGTYRQALIAALVLAATPALAVPTRPIARKEFDRGVAAYQKGDFAGASAAFDRSFALEPDAETLFAWAQAERKLEHCDKAVELYARLMEMDLPTENKSVIKGQIAECKKILEAQPPRPSEPAKPVEPAPPPVEPAPPVAKPEPAATPAASVTATAQVAGSRAWYLDPVGDTLTVAGIVGLGVGGALLVSAHSAHQGIPGAPDYAAAKSLRDQAESRGTTGSVSMIAGGAFVVAGIAWYATHASSSHGTTVGGWIAPTSGGLAIAGGF